MSKKQLLQKGNNFYKRGAYRKAANLYREVINMYGGDPIIYYKLGECLYKQKKYQLTLNAFNQALILQPNYKHCQKRKNEVMSMHLNQKEMQASRDRLRDEGEKQREVIIANRFNLGNYYNSEHDKTVLLLIKKLIEHDIQYHEIEVIADTEEKGVSKKERRKMTLHNICLTVRLLSKKFKEAYQGNQGFEEGRSIWRDIEYLTLFSIPPENSFSPHRYSLSDIQVDKIFICLTNYLLPEIERLLSLPDLSDFTNTKDNLLTVVNKLFKTREAKKELESKLNKYKEDKSNAEKRREVNKKNIPSHNQRLASLQDDFDYAQKNIDTSSDDERKKYQRQLNTLPHLIEDLNQKLKAAKIACQKDSDSLQASEVAIDKLDKELSQLKNVINVYNGEETSLRREISKIPQSNTFSYIYCLVNYEKEERLLRKLLQYTAPKDNNSYSKEEIMRMLQVIGECATKKNISEQTRALMPAIDWDLLIMMRNKLAHCEWDLKENKLENYLKRNHLLGIAEEDILHIHVIVKSLLENNVWKSRGIEHYKLINIIRNCGNTNDKNTQNNASQYLTHIRSFCEELPDQEFYKSFKGKLFLKENQTLLLKKVLDEIKKLETLTKSLKYQNSIRECKFTDDIMALEDNNHSKAATLYIDYLDSRLNKAGDEINEILKLLNFKDCSLSNYLKNEFNELKNLYAQSVKNIKIAYKDKPLSITLPRAEFVTSQHSNYQTTKFSSFDESDIAQLISQFHNFSKQCLLFNELESNLGLFRSLEYQVARIYPFLKDIENTAISKVLDELKVLELRIQRNYVEHGDPLVELLPQTEFLVAYIAKYLSSIKSELEKLCCDLQQAEEVDELNQVVDALIISFSQKIIQTNLYQDIIGRLQEDSVKKFSRSNTSYLESAERQMVLLYEACQHGMQYIVLDHNHDNPTLNALEFNAGIVILPELNFRTNGANGARIQLEAILAAYKNKNKPIYVCLNKGGYHFTTLVVIPGVNNTATYRYIEPLQDNKGEWISLKEQDKTNLQDALSNIFINGVNVLADIDYHRQQFYRGRHNDECGLHNVFNTLFMLQQGANADLAKMRQHLNIPGNNPSGNGGIDPEDAKLHLRPKYLQLFQQIIKAEHKAEHDEKLTAILGTTSLVEIDSKADSKTEAKLVPIKLILEYIGTSFFKSQHSATKPKTPHTTFSNTGLIDNEITRSNLGHLVKPP